MLFKSQTCVNCFPIKAFVKETVFNDYEEFNGHCMMLASEYPELFSYKYGFMTEPTDDFYEEGRKGVPFYKFGVKTLNGKFLYIVGFHDGGTSEDVKFIDRFWEKLGVWFLEAKTNIESLPVDDDLKGEVFWLMSLMQILKYRIYRTSRVFKEYSVEELCVLAKQDVALDAKIAALAGGLNPEEFPTIEGLTSGYVFAYADAEFVKSTLSQAHGFHVLKIDGLS